MSADAGAHGEDVAENWLRRHRYKILHRNYATPRYEIDIIAKHKRWVFFVEVKYRSTAQQGFGENYITERKLQQMLYAAESWVAEHDYDGPYQLAVISVDGDTVRFIDDIWT